MVQNEVLLSYKDWHIAISELEKLPYWQYEYILKEVNRINKEEEKRANEENEKYNLDSMTSDASSYAKKMNSSFKMPSMPNFNMPSMPKI